MRVLFVSSSFPGHLSLPNAQKSIGGVQRRQDMLIQAITEIAEIDFLFYVAPDFDVSSENVKAIQSELSKYWGTSINLFLCRKNSLPKWRQRLEGLFHYKSQRAFLGASGSSQVKAFEECLTHQPDIIFVLRLQSVYPIKAVTSKLPPIVYDIDDIEHLKLIRQIQQKGLSITTLKLAPYIPALRKGEYEIISSVQRAFVCSEKDQSYLRNQMNLERVITIENAIPIPDNIQLLTAEPNLFLLGTYGYSPNVEAANFLIEKVFPLVQQKIAEAKLIIAGGRPENIPAFSTPPPGVEFTGFVEDLESLYQRARVVCCPVFNGGGTRIKTIEAAAHGKAIVATDIGVEGLDLVPDQDFILSNTPQDFADAIIRLIKDNELAYQLGYSAYISVSSKYNRDYIKKKVKKEILELVS